MNKKIIGSTISGIVLLLALFIISFCVGDTKYATALNLTVLVFGAANGWLIGIVISPYSDTEQARFTSLSKAVVAFGSGYLVGKIDMLIEKLLDPTLVLESVHGFRLLAGLSVFALVMILTFVYRQYA
ncbi:hypothetical protein [Pseudomonas fluorescens]|uniref:hypothetical protein n=1 Tax=Pseudomonas fluorescens TaxID=294 RepID=UPI001241ED76|nr:hypothetical protein [Pseudomonas fluorescens]